MALQKIIKIVGNQWVKGNYFRLSLDSGVLARAALPGQFIHLLISKDCEPLLRRPFSIHQVSRGKVEILYEVVGKGTEILSQKKVGESLDVLGPLGKGFDYQSHVTGNTSHVLIAGGMG